MTDRFNLGIFGLGNVGIGIVQMLSKNQAMIDSKVGKSVRIKRAVVQNITKDRGEDLSNIQLSNNPDDILNDPEIDIVIEVIGGLDIAEKLILKALKKGKSVVTANKALLGERGTVIFPAANNAVGCFGFESSVGTAIPIIQTLQKSFAGDEIMSIAGIINGTSNYILTRMSQDGMEFEQALLDAQSKGLAETNPTLDIQGIDAAHKLIIMMNIAFGGSFEFKQLYIEGISKIRAVDIRYTKELGYIIKHLGIARKTDKGIEARVHPVLIPEGHILSSVNDAFNAISIFGKFIGPSMLYGLGAGPGPSAAGVLSDVIEACRTQLSDKQSSCTMPLKMWQPREIMPIDQIVSKYYLRVHVTDDLGVLAGISKILAEHRISVKSVIQKEDHTCKGGTIDIVLITHEALEADVQNALIKLNQQVFIAGETQLIRIDKWEKKEL
ncbi:MAG: homoserine dehydrogenase [Bacteroidetes bacterium]|nr:homoserine dehydrogenase [Bacteroidota bacterium]